jgi:hypothetical protein
MDQSIVKGDVDNTVIAACEEACWVAHGILVGEHVTPPKMLTRTGAADVLVLNETTRII